MAKTFRGGIHIPESKNTKDCAICEFPSPAVVSIPMQQHIGAPATPLVKKGDAVKAGQVIGRFDSGLSCPVHASVSGVVKDVEMRPSYTGYGKTAYVIIENDFKDELSEEVKPYDGDIFKAGAEDVIEKVKEAGISGMGGAAFPTYAKISSAIGKAKDVIINCAECEPYITANHRLMSEEPETIVNGAKILKNALNVESVIFAVEANKKDAAKVLSKTIGDDKSLKVVILKTKYPQGDERQLIYALKGVELPAGKLPADVGCVIFNAETASAVYHAMKTGMPLIKRVVTVDGDAVNEPKNIRVPIGTSYEDIFNFCGGIKENIGRIISGGPMMGNAQWSYDSVVMKNTSAILALSEKDEKKPSEGNCIHCGKCVSVCPMHLMPNYLAAFSKVDNKEMCEKFNILSCVECGCCTYICPGRVPIVQHIRNTKAQINAQRKKMAAAAAEKM
ncbi:MAG: electron transport complex subunit RsxC [Clostridia bacterium]|nr:electron transport complex subunit RsxC [Clostridia bacterium]